MPLTTKAFHTPHTQHARVHTRVRTHVHTVEHTTHTCHAYTCTPEYMHTQAHKHPCIPTRGDAGRHSARRVRPPTHVPHTYAPLHTRTTHLHTPQRAKSHQHTHHNGTCTYAPPHVLPHPAHTTRIGIFHTTHRHTARPRHAHTLKHIHTHHSHTRTHHTHTNTRTHTHAHFLCQAVLGLVIDS